MKRIWLFLVMVLCLAFAVRTLLLIDATALWSDELYSVGKSFQSSFTSMLAMLREDTHPPAYYALLWLWGHVVGQSPVGLRSLSWLAYFTGGMVMVRQAMALGPLDARVNVGTVAALLAFCSPYPVRFAIERKSYALLVLLVALAWIVYAANYLFGSRATSWIGPSDYALFEETLARGLGLWPLPKLGLILLLVVVFRRWGGLHRLSWPERGVMDRSGLIPSLLMVVGVVVVSFVKPMAFSRYFVVLLPAVVPVLAVQFGALNLNRLGRGCAIGVLGLLLASWWGPGFSELDPALGGVREQDQFRLVSQRTAGLVERYGPRARLLNLRDRMEVAMGRIPSDPVPWGDADDLEKRLAVPPLPSALWLASSGPPPAMERKLKPLQSQVVQAGYHCEQRANDLSHARLLRCRSEAMGRSE